ncbi:hypothetical protein H4R26_003005 [Coemansia thaxteri]|uniref:SHSP domain-containing protein n=1 Tax=Coemansia thaxteri TaxID=2663907 RepID=A0A9W8BIU3_9FUNG|nr:hypothetical protein H4R26_003005 [Coemansia thaxteri]
MSRRVTNFDKEFFANDSGFQSVHARTLPGRSLEYQSWFDSTPCWPPRSHLTHHYSTYNGGAPLQQQQLPSTRRPHYPTIFNDSFFKPPPSPADIKDHADRREISVTSDLFKDAKPSVQLKGRELRVHAAKIATGSSATGAATKGNEFEYKTAIPEGFNLAKISAKREGSVLRIVIPKK